MLPPRTAHRQPFQDCRALRVALPTFRSERLCIGALMRERSPRRPLDGLRAAFQDDVELPATPMPADGRPQAQKATGKGQSGIIFDDCRAGA